jgi:hypothetical protein
MIQFQRRIYPLPRINIYLFKIHCNMSSHLRLGLPKGLIPVGLANSMAYVTRWFNAAFTKALKLAEFWGSVWSFLPVKIWEAFLSCSILPTWLAQLVDLTGLNVLGNGTTNEVARCEAFSTPHSYPHGPKYSPQDPVFKYL